MGQPNPPGDNVPLIEGLGPEWNDVVSSFPEDRRSELGGILKGRIDAYAPLQEYSQFQKAGISAEQLNAASNLFEIIEKNPRQVYDTIGQHLGLTPAETKAAVTEMKKEAAAGTVEDPRIATMQQQIDTLASIALAQRQGETQAQIQEQADQELANDLSSLQEKVGEFDEEEVVMRMLHKNLTAEQAYQEYTGKFPSARRAAPFVMGQGGMIPAKQVDVRTLNTTDTKSLVTQMLKHANQEAQ